MPSLSLTFSWSGEEESLVEISAKVASRADAASQVPHHNEVVANAVSRRDAATSDQSKTDGPIEGREDRGAVEGDYRGVMGINRINSTSALGRIA